MPSLFVFVYNASQLDHETGYSHCKGYPVEKERLHVQLSDGREISAPLEWFPKLRDATQEQRSRWKLIEKGVGIHWDDVDEDLSVGGC